MRYLRVGVLAVVCLLAVAATGTAHVTKLSNGHRIGLMLRPDRSGGAKSAPGAILLNHRGPVLAAEAPYLIFWTPSGHSIPAASEGLMSTYLSDVAAAGAAGSTTNVYSVLGQYGSPYRQSFSSTHAIVDTTAYPAGQTGCRLATGMTACVSDASLQGEIGRLIDSGQLPQPSAPGHGTTPIVFVVTPVDVNVCTSSNSCVDNSFCAYHDYFAHGGGDVLYSSVPFSVFATSSKGCQTDQYSLYETPQGSSGDQAYNVADDLSHELSETITDPLINAWYSNNGYEVGDLCEAYAATANPGKGLSPLAYSPAFGDSSTGTLYDQVINRDQYYNQTEYSNNAGKCQAGLTPLS